MPGTLMTAGALRSRIRLERRVRVPDGAGGSTDAWTPVAVVWANVSPLTGRELEAAQQNDPQRTHTITIRYRSDVSGSDMRAIMSGRVFDLAPPLDVDELHVWLAFSATEVRG